MDSLLTSKWSPFSDPQFPHLCNGNGGGGLVAESCLLFATPWAVVCQASMYMGFSRHQYWSGLLFLSPRDLSNPRIKPGSPAYCMWILYQQSHQGSHVMGILLSKVTAGLNNTYPGQLEFLDQLGVSASLSRHQLFLAGFVHRIVVMNDWVLHSS